MYWVGVVVVALVVVELPVELKDTVVLELTVKVPVDADAVVEEVWVAVVPVVLEVRVAVVPVVLELPVAVVPVVVELSVIVEALEVEVLVVVVPVVLEVPVPVVLEVLVVVVPVVMVPVVLELSVAVDTVVLEVSVVVVPVVLELSVYVDSVALEVPVVVIEDVLEVPVAVVLEVRVDDSVDVVRLAHLSSHASYKLCMLLSSKIVEAPPKAKKQAPLSGLSTSKLIVSLISGSLIISRASSKHFICLPSVVSSSTIWKNQIWHLSG
jgi:hypothetical protein